MKKLIPQKLKNLYHLIQAVLANIRYGFPARKISVIGVTGTNGKTTTCQMVARILEGTGKKVAMASTINFKLGEKEWVNATKFTTVSAFATQKFIAEAVSGGCEYLVLETSSHSLDQYRVWGIKYDTAVITNITREHLDYHKTMEEYRAAKLKLFCQVKTAVVNLDMEKPEDFLDCGAEEVYGYTMKNENVNLKMENDNVKYKIIKAQNLKLEISESSFSVQDVDFKLNLLGGFNVENALAAICAGLAKGIDLKAMSGALEKIKKVPGRMDEVENELGVKIIIDYALTPDSMEKLGNLISKFKTDTNKIIWVFGSCGERDRGKRPIMGEIVAKYADAAIVTNEDPYGEDPQKIIDAVFAGVIKSEKLKENETCWRIFDRREAIKKALTLAQKNDIILVTGKGAEETMLVGKKQIPWNDRGVIEEILSHDLHY